MGEQGQGGAQAFADALRYLHVKAGAPTYAELVRQGRAQRPPVILSDASLSDWLNGKSTPARSDAVLFLVTYLEPKAMRRTNYELDHRTGGSSCAWPRRVSGTPGGVDARERPGPGTPTVAGHRDQSAASLVSRRPSTSQTARISRPCVRRLEGPPHRG